MNGMKTIQKNVTLNNGIEMPWIGLGVFRMDEAETRRVVGEALRIGYRRFDTAAYYQNEEAVGQAVKESNVPRSEVFVTTKLWNEDQRRNRVEAAFEESLAKLGMDYVDLYLVHWPVKEEFVRSWKILEGIYRSGRARAIGVSNFKEHHLDTLFAHATVVPAVNQVEMHPYLSQSGLVDYCLEKGIRPEAWGPFTVRRTKLLEEKVLSDIGRKYGKTPAQVILRWDVQRGVAVIPKSAHAERQRENISIFDFTLTPEEMQLVESLNEDRRIGADPDTFDF